MLKFIRRLTDIPSFESREKIRAAKFLIRFSWLAIAMLLALIAHRVFILHYGANPTVVVFSAMILLFFVGQALVRRGHVLVSAILIVTSMWGLLTALAYVSDGLRDLSLVAYIILIILASLLVNWRFSIWVTAASVLVIGWFAWLESAGARPLKFASALNYARDLIGVLILVGVLIYLLGKDWALSLRAAQAEIKQRLRVEEELQNQARYLSALNETALGLLNRSELRPLLELLLRRACELLNTQHGAIEMVLPDDSAMRQEAGVGIMRQYNNSLTLKNEGLTGAVWARGESIAVQNYAAWEHGLPEFIEAGLSAALGVPLKVGNTVSGVIVISILHEKRGFTQEQMSLMERLAALAAIAIDNARLYEQTQTELMERKVAEAALRVSEERTRGILAAIPDLIFEMSKNGIFMDVLASAEIQPLLPPAVFLGKNVSEVMPASVAQQTLFALERAIDTGQIHAFEYELLMSGEIRFFEARVSAISNSSAVVMVRDITQRKFVQAEREKLINELEEKNSELEQFTYTVSHDLKSPLITIKGFLGFLEKSAVSGNLPRLKADLQRIADATDKMQALLNNLLDLSRVGRVREPDQVIDMRQLAREVIDLLYGRLHERQVAVQVHENLPKVYGDRRRLFEALQNLVDNAAKFNISPNPQIEIGQRGAENGMPVFYVRDNGAGIAPEHHERVFGLFNKLDAQSEGTGIGLALVKRIIEVHKGRIWVESDGQNGSTFFFTLPPAAS